MTSKELVRNVSDAVSRAAFGKETITITRNGKPLCVLMPYEKPKKGKE